MEIAGRLHSYDDDGRVGVCAPVWVCVRQREAGSLPEFVFCYTLRCVCLLSSQKGQLGSTGFEVEV